MQGLKLYLLGEPRLEHTGMLLTVQRRKAWALLAYLAMSEQRQNRDELAGLLWPDLDQDHARAALRSTLSVLTNLRPRVWLDTTRSMLSLDDSTLWVDVREFLALLNHSRAHHHEAPSLCPECLDWLKQAIDLYHADFLAGFSIADSVEYDDWQLIQREWLRGEFAYALSRLAAYYGEQSEFDTAISYTKRWQMLDRLHEPAHRMLMHLYAASGRRAEALRQYQQCRELLDAELATAPENETTQLYLAIQADHPFSASLTASKGNASVLPSLPSLVIGRELDLNELKSRLGIGGELRAITILQGWPGVGKSTVVAALAHDQEVSTHFPDGILWASLGENPNLLSELGRWAQALGVADLARDSNIETLTAQLIVALRDRQMLLIVDDVWEVDHAVPFKVGGQACAMLLTSRLHEVALALAPTAHDQYRLAVLTETAALELLAHLTPETVASYPSESHELVRTLEGLPLALQVAGRLLHHEAQFGWGVGDLLRELQEGVSLLQARAPSDMRLGRETSPTIAALLKRSTDALDVDLRLRFALLSMFVPKPATFDLEAMAVAWGVTDPKPTARILVNRGLLEPLNGGRFQVHALLVLHARSLLEEMRR